MSLSDALVVTRGITFYGRLGFLPTPEESDIEHEDASAVVRSICESLAHAKRATVGALRDYLRGLISAMRRRNKGSQFWLKFNLAGIDYRLPVATDRAVLEWNADMKADVLAALRVLSKSSDATPLVGVIANAARNDACSDLSSVSSLMRHPSPYYSMRFDRGQFNQVTSAADGVVIAEWPDHVHFHRLMSVRDMVLEMPLARPLPSSKKRSQKPAASYCQ
jgi:hypothetical protein